MGAILNLSIIGMVITFLLGILLAFPTGSTPEDQSLPAQKSEAEFSVDDVHRVGQLFDGGFQSVLDELISHQTNPDFERADSKRQDMMNYASLMAEDFEKFEKTLEDKLNSLEIPELELVDESVETTP